MCTYLEKVQRHFHDDHYPAILQVCKETKGMAALDPSSRVFYHLARKLDASKTGFLD